MSTQCIPHSLGCFSQKSPHADGPCRRVVHALEVWKTMELCCTSQRWTTAQWRGTWWEIDHQVPEQVLLVIATLNRSDSFQPCSSEDPNWATVFPDDSHAYCFWSLHAPSFSFWHVACAFVLEEKHRVLEAETVKECKENMRAKGIGRPRKMAQFNMMALLSAMISNLSYTMAIHLSYTMAIHFKLINNTIVLSHGMEWILHTFATNFQLSLSAKKK